MAARERRRNLGRGLSALMGEPEAGPAETGSPRAPRAVPVDRVHPGRYQPRRTMDKGQMDELARSIREKGVLQPLLVRHHPSETGAFEIVAGERRWRAAQQARLHEVPVIVKDFSDAEALEVALVENLQRQDLSPLEEAQGYRQLKEEFAHTQERLAQVVGKSRSHVANMLRLLDLPEGVKNMLDAGQLTAGHGRALVGAADPLAVAKKVLKEGLNVRQTERLAAGGRPKARRQAPAKDADTRALERDLGNRLGLKVTLTPRGAGGALTLHYESLEQLDDILERLSGGPRALRIHDHPDGSDAPGKA